MAVNFENPPVVEVALSVQFEAPLLDSPTIMVRWAQIRDRFPKYQLAPPLPSGVESFNGQPEPELEFHISSGPPTPRLVMLSESESKVLQIQHDRFGYGWQKITPGDEYPGFLSIRREFSEELQDFKLYLSAEGHPRMAANQCEVTYVNLMYLEDVANVHGHLDRLIPSVTPHLNDDFLPRTEETRYSCQYVIGDRENNPIGRLYVSADPGYLADDNSPMYILKLTARGVPQGAEDDGILRMLDIGHEWITRGFASLTDTEMHNVWRRKS